MDEFKAKIERYISDKNYEEYFFNVRVKENGTGYTVRIDYSGLSTNKLIKASNVDKSRRYTSIDYSSNEIFFDVKGALGNPGLKEVTDFLYFSMLP